MSSRSKKKSQQTVHQESFTHATPSSSKSPGRNRPPSPTAITRTQEKNELANLNDRLAQYIDRVRFLEGENSRLSSIIRTQEETVHRESSGIKLMYEGELRDARKLLDETAKEKAKLQLELNTALADCKEYKDKYLNLRGDLKDKDRRLLNAESQVADLQARLSDAVTQRKHWESEYGKLKREYDELVKALENAKKQVEEETLQRVNLQNRLQTLREEIDFKESVHRKELDETRTTTRVEIEEVDSRYQAEFDSRLMEEIQSMRAENDAVVENAREEAAAYFEKKIQELQARGAVGGEEAERLRGELRNVRIRLDEVTTESSKLSSQNSSLEARVRDLVNQLRRQQEEHDASMSRKDGDIRTLKQQLEEQLAEYRDLLSIKIQLDNEIATYNRLLEAEESRLNISQTSQSSQSPFAQRSVRRTLTGRKRKREGGEASFIQSSKKEAHWAQSASTSGPIEIEATDLDGKYVKLKNTTDEDVHMGGWKIHHFGDEETIFKFHRSLIIKAGETCMVWSSDIMTEDDPPIHNPPSDIVMKGKRFFTGDKMKTVLLNNNDEEKASRECEKSMHKTSYAVTGGSDVDSGYEVGREALYYRQGEVEPRGESCLIM